MADEPRRSGRATKGQHKNLELPDAPTKKGKSKSPKDPKDKSSKASAEPTPGPSDGEEEEIIRCICGEYEEEEDVERDMICCDQCSAWQHNDCMGLTFAKGQEPDHYYCEQCKPENHKVLLEKIARGEKPWEEVAEKRRREAEEKKAKRKKGKKGGRKSQGKAESSTPARAGTSATPGPGPAPAIDASASAEPENNGHVIDSRRSSTTKRKLEDSVETESGPQVKQQRVTPQATSLTAQNVKAESPMETLPEVSVDTLQNPARKSAATALVKLFVDQIKLAQKQGSTTSLKIQSVESIAHRLGSAIEDAMYRNFCGDAGEPSEPYKLQLRTILFNVKKNPSLRDRLLSGNLSPESLAQMKAEDMASEELQQKDAEIKREAERQHIIVQEEGPRIRRTHKGEELVEDETHNAATESVFSAGPRRAMDADPTSDDHSPLTPRGNGSQNDHGRGQSPSGVHHDHVFPEVSANIHEPVPHGRKVQADAEIDQLLRDEEPESPPYSPKDFGDDAIVWRGKVAMIPVSEFSSTAKHVGGAELSGRIPWSQLAPSNLMVDGRIDIQLASSYLCGLRFSSSTDVSVIAISYPEVPADRAGFDKLFDYFKNRSRYGVIGKHPLPAVKDTYIIPIEAGTTTKPEFIELLENNTLEDSISERMLLVVFVVKTGESNSSSLPPPSHRPGQESAVSASPMPPASLPQQQSSTTPAHDSTLQPTMPQPSPPVGGVSSSAPYSQPTATQTGPGYQPQSRDQAGLKGLAAAIQVLGAQVNSPAIQQLLKTAPNVDVAQLNVVRDILAQQPAAAGSYDALMQALFETQANGRIPS
ncbi:Uncharacterized protein PECH_008701 [Penicillium ucsense]|uniref:Transcription factor BYE1 n=1 Tax=Penicillium ucsense TaxID=2839758 RepID=A0A8J8W2L1_9EURO|nr:Uncharacterized protein PECM_006132 [Penicillium ucsense]KAF7734041.1 Uncharacterized protein PECH_008701 [Penicillium ucsense]